jgi:phytoene dehydrogenase-like protein
MYDVVIIGAGMSGLAAGIRLAMFDRRVCVLERHYAVGGLNSYYRLDGRNYDVGLHALTNFARRGSKRGPLPRLLRQLRLSWDDFELAEQNGSVIAFPEARLRFNNDPALLATEIERAFPNQRDGYQRLLGKLLDYHQLQSPQATASAREVLAGIFSDRLLIEMLLCPVMFYGSAREHDLDWGSFSVLFRAIFLEGLCRPRGGIRTILKHLLQRFKRKGGELRLRAGVREIISDGNRAVSVVLDDGSELRTRQVMSSAGWNETMRLCAAVGEEVGSISKPSPSGREQGEDADLFPDTLTPSLSQWEREQRPSPQIGPAGNMTFIESICTLDCQPRELGFDDTIVFYNGSPQLNYARPDDFADVTSGIICSPNNYLYGHCQTNGDAVIAKAPEPAEGTIRLTALANYDRWSALEPAEYQNQKRHWLGCMLDAAARFVPDLTRHIVAHDLFTPITVRHFTGHDHGAVYGAPQKRYDATTHLENLWVCGADQGYVGIVGTLTSGIQVANKLLRRSS